MQLNLLKKLSPLLILGVAVAGCESKAGQGAIIGGLAGGALGGVIGHQSDEAVAGAAIGAGVGAVGGGLVGHAMDKEDQKKERARYERDYDRDYQRYDSRSYESRGSSAITQGDVIAWTDSGVKDEIIIDRIQRSGQVFRLTAADESDLRDAGVSSKVIRAMKDTARR